MTGIHNSYTLYVEASDSGVPSRATVASVNISIIDANDHAPQFSQSSYFTGKRLSGLLVEEREIL